MKTPIIQSFLDVDFYKLTMMNIANHYENNANVKYKFFCRTPINLRPIIKDLKTQIEMLDDLRFTRDELDYLRNIPYFRDSFIRFLAGFKFDHNDVKIVEDESIVGFNLTIDGNWVNTILYETMIMGIISELHFRQFDDVFENDTAQFNLLKKCNYLKENINKFPFAEFGTRRRFSRNWQEFVVSLLHREVPNQLVGTSNVDLARRLGLNPIGTMAHEYIMFHASVTRPDLSNQLALNRWLQFYEGNLGTALTDTYTTDFFLKDFNSALARGFTGVRQDSGDPIEWGYKMLNHYKKLEIHTENKQFLFSDGLDFQHANSIYNEFKGKCKPSFGIGTYLTNDTDVKSLNIVIKMVEANGFPLIKISDSVGKTICEDEDYKRFALKLFKGR